MSKKQIIHTPNAPKAIGTYSQAVKVESRVYISGQIPLDPQSMQLIDHSMAASIERVFLNLQAVAQAAGGTLNDIVKLNIYLIDLSHFALVNEIMAEFFSEPFPARAAVGVAALPKNASVEMDAILELDN